MLVKERLEVDYGQPVHVGKCSNLIEVSSDCFLLLSDRYVLLHFTFQSLVLHDLYNDTYHELTELDLKGGRPEVLFQSYSLSQTEEAVYVYESKPYVSPALLVKIYIAGE